jgi:F0F1-type ATP synthase assembly protein I
VTDNGVRHDGERSGTGAVGAARRVASASQRYAVGQAERQSLNKGFGDSMARAFELALTPTIMAGLGWLLDRWLGTSPIFLVGLAVFTFVYVIWKMAKGYDATMREQEAELVRKTRGGRAA